ncbi:MAG: IS3 family transposase [Breznakia sp.]
MKPYYKCLDDLLRKLDNFKEFMEWYVQYFNNERPAYSLNYKSPIQYRTE